MFCNNMVVIHSYYPLGYKAGKNKRSFQCGIDKIFDRVNSYLSELYDAVKVFTANGEQTRGKHTVH